MKTLRLIPLLGALAFLGAATTASASPKVTMGKFSPGHQGAAAPSVASQPCNARNRACSSADRFALKSRAYGSSEIGDVTKGRFKAVFVNEEIASID